MKKIAALLLLASCNPTAQFPGNDFDYCTCPEWKNEVLCDEQLTPCWWNGYNDPCLNDLMDQAIANNFDLAIAAERVLQAKALAGIACSKLFPQVTLDPNISRESAKAILDDFGLGDRIVRIEQRQYSFPFDLNYELDLWGKYRNLNAAARERFFASEFNQRTMYLMITSETANLYFTLRTLDDEIRYLKQAVQVREDYRDVNLERLKCGLDSEIDVTRSNLDLALAESELEDAKRLRGLAENGLGLLLGYPACSFSLPPGSLPQCQICPSPDLPSTLIAKRPDVQEKFHSALAALNEIGVAKADFFPQFNLTGSAGLISPTFNNWFEWSSRFYNVIASATQVIFDAGRLFNNLDLKKAEYREKLLSYHKQVTIAMKEVEDALNEMHYRRSQTAAQELAVFYSQDTSHLARNQYETGLINYLLVADAEKTQLNTRRTFIRLQGSLYLASVQLAKALGGGYIYPIYTQTNSKVGILTKLAP